MMRNAPEQSAAQAVLGLLIDGRARPLSELARALRMSRASVSDQLGGLIRRGLVRPTGSPGRPQYVFAAERYAVAWAFVEDAAVTVELAGLDLGTVDVRAVPREHGRECDQVERLVAQSAAAHHREVLATVVASNDVLEPRTSGAGRVRVERTVHLAAYGEFRRIHPDQAMLYFAFVSEGRMERGIVVDGRILRGAGGIAGLIDDHASGGAEQAGETASCEAQARRLGETIGEDLRLLNPSAVVLSSLEGDPNGEVLARVRHAIYSAVSPSLTGSLTIAWSGLGRDAPAVGAKELALDLARSPESLAALLADPHPASQAASA